MGNTIGIVPSVDLMDVEKSIAEDCKSRFEKLGCKISIVDIEYL